MSGILTNCRILVVEDEMLLLMTIETVLADLGYSAISCAANVTEALALVGQRRFDAALLDVNLGGEASYPVADALARLGIPFVFATGYRDYGGRIDFADRPKLKKPYSTADLETAFKRLLTSEPWPALV